MALAGSDHFVANFNAVQALSRSIDRVFEEAQLSGVLSLNGRNLKEFPSAADRYDLTDTVVADLAKNRLTEFPIQLCDYGSLETLILYHNCIRSIPLAVQFLTSLTYLDLSRNQLVTIPTSLSLLPLEVLILNNNRIQSIPNEICRLSGTLMELDVSCNKLTTLPLDIGDLNELRVLDARENLLSELPSTISKIPLQTLDVSSNKLSFLDVSIRYMTSLLQLNVANNPLVFPPSNLCDRGCVHIFRALELECVRRTKRRPRTSNSTESDVVERRKYRMANAVNGNIPGKVIPTNSADYKYSMTLGALEHRRKHRHHTIASETRFIMSTDDCCNTWNAVSNDHPLDNIEKPSMNALLQKRSSPVGEEVPPPPPCKFETTAPSSHHTRIYGSRATSNARSLKMDTAVDAASFVDEVMAACREKIENGHKSAVRNERAALDDATDGDQATSTANGRQLASKRNTAGSLSHFQKEKNSASIANSTNVSHTPAHSVVATSAYVSQSIDHKSTPPASVQQLSIAQLQRTTYSIQEESDTASHSTAPVAASSYTVSTLERPLKTPPKSARSDVIQSIYTSSTNVSPNVKKLSHNSPNQSNVHPCCPQHGAGPSTSPPHGQDGLQANGTVVNGCAHKEDENMKNEKENGSDDNHTISTVDDEVAQSAEKPGSNEQPATNAAKAPTIAGTGGARNENQRKNSLSKDTTESRGQKKTTSSVTGIRTSTSSQAIKNGTTAQSQHPAMVTSISSQRLSTAAGPKSTPSGAVANGAVGALAMLASRKITPPSLSQDAAKHVAVASKVTSTQKDNAGPVFHRASASGEQSTANQNRASRSRESLANGTSCNGTNSRKGESNDKNYQIIDDMRQVLEKTLKISLPSNVSDLADTLSDGVYLCNFVNTIRARTIPSVHTPTDPMTKLPIAKSRRNVENFLMGCRRLGVAESQLFNMSDIVDKKALGNVAKTVQALMKQATISPSNVMKTSPLANSVQARITNV